MQVCICFLLQGIFPTQRLNPGLPNCRQMLYLSHQGGPYSYTIKINYLCMGWSFSLLCELLLRSEFVSYLSLYS